MSRHWKPERRGDWIVIEGYGGEGGRGGGALGVVVGAVMIGLLFGGFLAWSARQQAEAGPSSAIEWNVVQKVPTRTPDAADLAWEKRAAVPDGGRTVAGANIRVIDGDTFDLNGARIRVAGIDAPETHPAHCAGEARLGEAATQKLAALLRSGTLWVSGEQTDRWGRSVRTVRVNGEDVADAMIGSGLARNYDGGQRESWC